MKNTEYLNLYTKVYRRLRIDEFFKEMDSLYQELSLYVAI